jgi:hypothetical protein
MQSSTCGACLRVTDEKWKSVTATQMLCARQGTMSNMPVNVAVFFGKVDRRPSGWYWTPISDGEIPHSGSIVGPFESKPKAVEDANQKMRPCA